MAKIQLNGKNIFLKKDMSLGHLLKSYKLNEKKVAVELNGQIVLRQNYRNKILNNKDKIEIVHFIGGG